MYAIRSYYGCVHGGEEGRVGLEGRKIRLREVAVVLGALLGSHGLGLVPVLVPKPSLLAHRAALLEYLGLPLNLVVNRITSYNVCYTKLLRQVTKLSPDGRVLLKLGKPGEGAGQKGLDTFDAPTGVVAASNGDIFVAEGHGENTDNNSRIMKFTKEGRFICASCHDVSNPVLQNLRHNFV